MSTFQQNEQGTPSIPAATTQLLYPKTDGQYIMASDGIEKKIITSRDLPAAIVQLNTCITLVGGL